MSKAPVKLRHSPPDLHERPGFLVRRANQILMSLAEQETAKIGLTPPQHVHLLALGRWGALDQITLGKALGIDRATVGQVVGRLEARGLLQRKLDPKDGRVVVGHVIHAVRLQPDGQGLAVESGCVSHG